MKLLHAALLGSLSLFAIPPALMAPALAQTTATAPSVDPAAAAALARMGAYLRTLRSFEVTVHSSTEDVLESGLKVQTGNKVLYVVDAPGKMFAEVSGDKRTRQYFYDGTTFTVRGGQNDYYAQVPATGTIPQLMTKVYEKYGINFPLQDLFRWGDPSAVTAKPYQGFLVGSSKVGDWDTDHYIFRQQGVDFQVWIEKGDKPLPRKMVITNIDDPAQPEYIAILNWNLSPSIPAGRFTYVPDANAHKIPFLADAAPAAAAK